MRDEELLRGIYTGERAALEGVYATCFPTVKRLVLSNNGSEEEAKDVFQEAVMVLYDKLQQQKHFELSCRLGTFLYAVSRRLWLKMLRNKGRFASEEFIYSEEETQFFETEQDLLVHQEKEAQFQLMEQSLQRLGDPCRQILLDFYMRGKSMQRISEELGYTNAENVKNQKYKCLQRLKKYYFKEEREG